MQNQLAQLAKSNHAAHGRRSGRSRRCGIALAEVVCMLIVSAILASICFPLIAKLYVANGQLKHELKWQRGVHELGLQLRRDARIADAATVDGTGKLLLETTDTKIEYEFVDGPGPGGLDGVVRRTASTADGELLGREGFLIADQSSATFDTSEDRLTVQLKIPSFRLIKRSEREIEILAKLGGLP